MASYPYLPLPTQGNYIRLLRLLPNEDEAAPLQCELLNYPLQKSGPRTHLYEALSYVWGDPRETLPIHVDKNPFPITVNLHAALSRLRDHFFERVMWVDAICINQKNPEEQGQQVQLMAKIYSNAHRVIVWLGEEVAEIKGALEDIRFAAYKEGWKKELNQQAIFNLLQRPWFQRIWVLQEVAAARHVVVICGSAEIDGYAFCLGLKSLLKSEELSYIAFPEFQSLSSLTNLIEQAGLRPRHTPNSLERYSLEIRPLAELVDMFHTRQASDPRDKVYALLGMSLDDPSEATLQPDYTISWEKLFEQLVKFVLGEDAFVETSSQRAIIKSKGCILGQVSSVKRDDRQIVNITSSNAPWDLGGTTEWTLQASAKPIQKHDIICLLHGASKPTIIRLCKDHFAVIIIAANPLNRSSSSRWPETFQSATQFLRDLLLVWDWENPQGKLQDQEEYKTLTEIYSQALEYSKAESGGYLCEATRLWNDIMILDDLREHEKANQRLLEATSGYMAAFGKDHLPRLISQYGRTLLSFAAGEGHEDIVKLLLEIVDPDIKDGKSSLTPLWWAARNGHEAVVKLLLATGQVEVDSKDKGGRTPLWWAAENGHEAVVKLLLATGQVEVDSKDTTYGRTPLWWAARYGHEAVVKLLLATGQVEVDSKDTTYGRTPLSWAAGNGHEAVVKLLLATGQVEVDSKDTGGQTPLSWAAEIGHEAVVKLLLATGQVEVDSKDTSYGRTPLSWAAGYGHEAVVKLLLATGQVEVDSKDTKDGQTPLSWAAENGHEAVVKLLLATGQVEVDSKDTTYGRTPLSWAAGNGHEAVVKLLLATGQVEVDSKDTSDGRTPLSWAAGIGHEAVVKLLLATGQVEVDSKDTSYGRTPLWWAAGNGREAVVKLLLATGQVEVDSKDKGGQTPLSWAAGNGHEAVVKLLLATGQVEVDSKDTSYGRTPLSWAAENGHEAVVKLLLATGQVEVDSKDTSYGRTPLSWAAGNGREAVVKLLLATGQVEVDSKDKGGRTPLSWAAEIGHEAVVKLLHKYIN